MATLAELHVQCECLLARHILESGQHEKLVAKHRKVLKSWHEMEKASLDQEIDLQKSVLRMAHTSEVDAMDFAI